MRLLQRSATDAIAIAIGTITKRARNLPTRVSARRTRSSRARTAASPATLGMPIAGACAGRCRPSACRGVEAMPTAATAITTEHSTSPTRRRCMADQRIGVSRGSMRLEELDAVAERVMDVDPVVALEGLVVDDLDTSLP